MGYIQQKVGDIMGIVQRCLTQRIPKLFTSIHNNPKLPEYHNVYLSRERDTHVHISNGESFVHAPKKMVIEQIIEDNRESISRYLETHIDQLGHHLHDRYEDYQDSLDTNKDGMRKDLQKQIESLLLDMKDVVERDKKEQRILDTDTDADTDVAVAVDADVSVATT